jgi:energy-converting hydrogenase Eha subunit C
MKRLASHGGTLVLLSVGPALSIVLHDVPFGPALSLLSGNVVSRSQVCAACAYLAAYLASHLLTPIVLISLALQWLVRSALRYHAAAR